MGISDDVRNHIHTARVDGSAQSIITVINACAVLAECYKRKFGKDARLPDPLVEMIRDARELLNYDCGQRTMPGTSAMYDHALRMILALDGIDE